MMINYNGEIISEEEWRLTADDRAFNYGDGLFETFFYSKGKIHWFEDHYFRLMGAMRVMRMEIPMSFTPEYLEEQITELIAAEHWEREGVRVRMQVWRKPGGKYRPESRDVHFLIRIERMSDSLYPNHQTECRIDIFKDFYKQEGLLGNLKSSNAQLYILASIFAEEQQLDDCILLNPSKNVTESTASNIFIVHQGKLKTPLLSSGCLRGIMRKQIIDFAPEIGLEVVEEDFNPFTLLQADEIWLTNVIQGVRPVTQYRKKVFSRENADKMQEVLNEKINEVV